VPRSLDAQVDGLLELQLPYRAAPLERYGLQAARLLIPFVQHVQTLGIQGVAFMADADAEAQQQPAGSGYGNHGGYVASGHVHLLCRRPAGTARLAIGCGGRRGFASGSHGRTFQVETVTPGTILRRHSPSQIAEPQPAACSAVWHEAVMVG
jgi:hypothetical protein